jgi:flagella basal body P-ring formation protein FlgA
MRYLGLIILSGAPLLPAEPCIPVTGAWITAADLGRIEPAFLAMDPDSQILRSPRFGVQRHVAAGELAQLTSRWNLGPGGSRGGCFEHPRRVLTEGDIREGILKAWDSLASSPAAARQVNVELLDWPREPLPAGQLSIDLKRKRVSTQPDDAVSWVYGEVRFEVTRKLPVWIRADLSFSDEVLVAASQLTHGTVLAPEHLKKEFRRLMALTLVRSGAMPLKTIQDATGKSLISDLAPGAVLTTRHLEPAGQIRKGEQVTLQVVSGSARLRLKATAETPGVPGDQITLRIGKNPQRLVARIMGPGEAQIEAGANKRGIEQH